MSPSVKQWLRLLHPRAAQDLVTRRIAKWRRKLSKVDQAVCHFEPRPGTTVRGDALVAYIADAFLLKTGPEPIDESLVPHSHTHWWESLQIVQTFLDLGYRVDAISWQNTSFVPQKKYDVVLDVRILLEHWKEHLPADCVKILHAETAHWSWHNPAQEKRLEALWERRGRRSVAPNKMIEPNRALESADAVTVIGERADWVQDSYRRPGTPMHGIPISTPHTWPRLDRDFESARRRFFWFGSAGLVHKGLDLVLEAFAGMPEFELTLFGPIDRERDFEREYWRELHETPNIHLHGWVDIKGPDFVELMSKHVAVVFPSCSESQNGGIITCMHAGAIPILSHETGIPLEPSYGRLLDDCQVETVQGAVRALAELPPDELASISEGARQYARSHHTRERFAKAYRDAIESILEQAR